jgi:NADH-quinone oxidoreductase subunit J
MPDFFTITSLLVLTAAGAAVSLRRPIHCVLFLILVFLGLAAMFLQLGAEFVGFAQILVYVGAVAMLMVFALLLTQNGGTQPEARRSAGTPIQGVAVAFLVFGCLVIGILASDPGPSSPAAASSTTRQIGEVLMTRYVLPLQVVGLLLTAALIGAVLIAMRDDSGKDSDRS